MTTTKNLFWYIFAFISGLLLIALFLLPVLNFGGDIVEYHGITESLIKNGSIALTKEAADNLSHYLQPAYLVDPQYYIQGVDGKRYPVHFIFYSLLAMPIRILLKVFQLNELNTLRLTNLALLTATSYYLLRTYLTSARSRVSYLLLTYLSPLMWFLIWPGPDVYYLCMMLLSLFFFFDRRFILALVFMALASWQSQPLIIAFAGMFGYYLSQFISKQQLKDGTYVGILINKLPLLFGIGLLALVPYAYNFYFFGTFTPWTILKDGWTLIHGFGPQNMSLKKLYEQFFDLNFGLFWYAPVILTLGVASVITERKNRQLLLTAVLMVITAFFYQTNPAWHYGTSGFGPSRHAIFLLPFLIYAGIRFLDKFFLRSLALAFLVITQLGIMSFNGFISPNLLNTLQMSPYASFVLDHAASLYNPTPEIFVDRTLHADFSYPKSAYYKVNGKCTKAYVLLTDKDALVANCGYIPTKYQDKFDDPYSRKTNYPRQVKTISATFWPDPGSCGDNFFPTPERPYVCMKTLFDVMKDTGLVDPTRFTQVDKLPGVWRLKEGTPVNITIPPGYFVQHYSFDGFYVNY